MAKVFATTGIAATLMEGGVTVHSGFGIPVESTRESQSFFLRDTTSRQCRNLRETHVFLNDEITMMVKDTLRMIANLLKGIMNSQVPFGGKVIVVGGDFRQLLPVVPRGTRPQILAECVISSHLWQNFQVFTLSTNMRAQNDLEFAEWLLQLGTGTLPPLDLGPAFMENAGQNMVEIPREMLLQVPPLPPQPRGRARAAVPPVPADEMPREMRLLIEAVFGNDVNALTTDELSKRAILASTIKQTMIVNNHMIGALQRNEQQYLSIDKIVSDDPDDERNFPEEYLNQQHPSGMPGPESPSSK